MKRTITASKFDISFDKALVLLGVLAAAELSYVTALSMPITVQDQLNGLLGLADFTYRITTTPFIVLVIAWIVKELIIKLHVNPKLEITVTLFCWDFWAYSLYWSLIVFFSLLQKQFADGILIVGGCFALVVSLIIVISWAYGKSRANYQTDLYSKNKWYKSVALFCSLSAFIPSVLIALWSITAFR
jgi:hypothetical protein